MNQGNKLLNIEPVNNLFTKYLLNGCTVVYSLEMMFVRYWDFVEGVKSYEEMLWFSEILYFKVLKFLEPVRRNLDQLVYPSHIPENRE
uniref:Uncharacterized protein n=1 Tax=Ignisphaera aggregans TaxID=334771 RepID=A0A7C5TFV8_9CREN